MRKGDFEAAARYLVLPPGEEGRGAELARRLRAVLERHLDIQLDSLSPAAEGNREDGLPEGVDSVGQVPDGQGGRTPCSWCGRATPTGARWAFSRQTVSQHRRLVRRAARPLDPRHDAGAAAAHAGRGP